MTNEEFQKLVLEKLVGLEQGQAELRSEVTSIKSAMATKSDIEHIVTEQQKDVTALLQLMNGKLDKQSEILKILSSRSIEQEAEIIVLKKAK